MKTQVFFLIAFCLFAGCSGKNLNTAGDALSMELTSTDYDIISLALDHFFGPPRDSLGKIDSSINKWDNIKLLTTSDSTIQDPKPNRGYSGKMYNLIDSTGKFISEQRCKIDCSKILSFNVYSLTEQEKKEIYGLSYAKFYEKFPDAYGSIFFSRPSYFQNKERAIIYIEFYKEVLWAEAAYLFFRYENGKWIFIRKDQVWVS